MSDHPGAKPHSPLSYGVARAPRREEHARPRYAIIDAIRRNEPVTSTIHDSVRKHPAIVETRDFALWYRKTKALHEVSMPFAKGKVTSLIGPSGCGKSTLLRSINRLNDLIEGVRVGGGIDLSAANIYRDGTDVIDLRRRVGMVFQKPNPFPMSIFDNVVYALRVQGEKRRRTLEEAAERALKGAALWEEVKDRLKESALGLSGGQQQRLCIARAIVVDPEVLLLDEPCSALDPIATVRIEELIQQISARYTVIIVTHNMQQAARISDYTAFMYLGRLIEYGATADIFQNPKLTETEEYVTGRFG
jgi:phosphate transport system ATP-binding protein